LHANMSGSKMSGCGKHLATDKNFMVSTQDGLHANMSGSKMASCGKHLPTDDNFMVSSAMQCKLIYIGNQLQMSVQQCSASWFT